MTRFAHLASGIALVTGVALPACSGDRGSEPGDDGTPAFSTAVAVEQRYADVDDADIAALCEAWASRLVGSSRAAFCNGEGWRAAAATQVACLEPGAACALTDEEAQTVCADAQDACEAPIGLDEVIAKCDFQKPDPTCTATVGEFEACIAEVFSTMEEVYGAISCSDVTVAELRATGVQSLRNRLPPGDYPLCRAFNTECPGAFRK